jgi:2-polyprenyl-3-methyl-5-hydroxy-6-metoxy-1,4-benzoquinol methylase
MVASELETVACDLCGCHEHKPYLVGKDRGWGSFKLVQCLNCGLVFTNPRPTPSTIGRYYPSGYYAYHPPRDDWLKRLKRRITLQVARDYWGYVHVQSEVKSLLAPIWSFAAWCFRFKLCKTPRCVPGGRLLDIGCATGNYLATMQSLGWEVYGVEIDEGAARYAREQLGLHVVTGTLERTEFPDSFFDAVTMWDVLEHMHRPLESLRQVTRLLKREGQLLLKVPNIGSLQARIFKDKWSPLDLPRHLYFFSPRTVSFLLQKAGLFVERVEYASSPHCMSQSLDYTWSDYRRNSIENVPKLVSFANDIIGAPLSILADLLSWGDAIVVWANKVA